jgi:hypothetical protein
LVITQYATSMLDQKIVVWCFEDQDTGESPRKTQYLDIDRLVSWHPTQSASKYALIATELIGQRCKTKVDVP